MKALNVGILTALTSSLLFGCSASVDATGTPDQVEQFDFMDPATTIQGPSIEGKWKSSCNYNYKNDNYRTLEIIAKGQNIERTESQFTDSECQTSASTKKYSGKFRFIEKLKDNIYKAEYALDIGNGARTFPLENIQKTEEALYIGDFRAGEGMGVLKDEPLFYNGVKKDPTEKPEAGKTEAQVATQYAEAKFAMCDVQGNQYIIDLSKLNLTQSGQASVKFGTADCDGTVNWFAENYTGQVSQSNNFPQITFSTNPGDGIKTWKEGTGLSQHSYIRKPYAVIAGNSGFCYFLKTPTIKNLEYFCK